MNKKESEAFARKAAKGLKTEKDLHEFSQMLTKKHRRGGADCRNQ